MAKRGKGRMLCRRHRSMEFHQLRESGQRIDGTARIERLRLTYWMGRGNATPQSHREAVKDENIPHEGWKLSVE